MFFFFLPELLLLLVDFSDFWAVARLIIAVYAILMRIINGNELNALSGKDSINMCSRTDSTK